VPFPALSNRLNNLLSTDRLAAFVHLHRSHIERGTRGLSRTDHILTAISAADNNLSVFTRLVQKIRQLLPCFGVGVYSHIGRTAVDLVNEPLRLLLSISNPPEARVRSAIFGAAAHHALRLSGSIFLRVDLSQDKSFSG
jgi:hypothetical protein